MIRVVLAGEDSLHNLTNHQQRWIARVVIDIFQSHINAAFVVVVQYDQIIAASSECRLEEVKVNRRHLRAENRIVFAHLFCEQHSFHAAWLEGALLMALVAHADGGEQGTDTDARRTEIVHFIYFQAGINLA